MRFREKIVALFSASAMMISMAVPVSADNSAMLWSAEFDGNDDMSAWTKYTSADKPDTKAFDFSGLISDGVITMSTSGMSYGRMGAEFADGIDVSGAENIYWETRFRFPEKMVSNDDKMFMVNDGRVLIAQLNGVLYYGGDYGDTDSMTLTGVEMQTNVWYTLLVRMNFVEDSYSIVLTGEDGADYEGDAVSFSNGDHFETVSSLKLPRQRISGLVTNIDYTRLWNDGKVMSVNVTYGENNRNLSSAINVKTEFDCTVNFSEAVSSDALEGISIDNDGRMELTGLSEDGKKAYYHISGLEYSAEYNIYIPAIGSNPEKEISFETEEYTPPEIRVVHGIDDEDLDNAKDISKNIEFRVLFELPITADEAQSITIDNDAYISNYSLSDDGRVLTVRLSGLAGYTRYKVSIPQIGGNGGKDVTFTTVDDISYIVKLDFEGNDNESSFAWTSKRDTTAPKDMSGRISNGVMHIDRNDMGSQEAGISFDEPVDIKGRENVYFETRIKYSMRTPRADGLLASSIAIANVFGTTTNYQEAVFAKDGYFWYGGTRADNAAVNSGYPMYNDKWYTIRIHINNGTRMMGAYIADDEGNIFDAISDPELETQMSYGLAIDNVYHLLLAYTADLSMEVDYIRFWDSDIRITNTNIKAGETNISNDTDFVIDFSKDIDAASVDGITVTDSDSNIVPVEIKADGRKAAIYFKAGLKYGEEYAVVIPSSVKDTEGKGMNETVITFTTEDKPLKVDQKPVVLGNGTAVAEATVYNTTFVEKTICVLVIVYDSNSTVIKMQNEKRVIPAGGKSDVSVVCSFSDPSAASAKAYFWNGIDFER